MMGFQQSRLGAQIRFSMPQQISLVISQHFAKSQCTSGQHYSCFHFPSGLPIGFLHWSGAIWKASFLSFPPELCLPTSGVQGISVLQLVDKLELLVPRLRTSVKQWHSFSVASSRAWNGLLVNGLLVNLLLVNGVFVVLQPVPRGHTTTFFTNFKTVLLSRGWTESTPLRHYIETP